MVSCVFPIQEPYTTGDDKIVAAGKNGTSKLPHMIWQGAICQKIKQILIPPRVSLSHQSPHHH